MLKLAVYNYWRDANNYQQEKTHLFLNWCPVIVSNRQQVSPILQLAVISLLIDQWDDLLQFKFSVGCKLFDSYDILLILITKAKRVLWKNKNKYTLRYWIPVSNFVGPRHFYTVQSSFP